MKQTTHCVIAADGHFDSEAVVFSAHYTQSAAVRTAKRFNKASPTFKVQVIECPLKKGFRVSRHSLGFIYPRVKL